MPPLSNDPSELQFLEDLADRLSLAVEAVMEQHDLSQGGVAERIGVSQQRLSNWTGKQNRPDWFAVAKLCRTFGISADWLLFGDRSGLRISLADSLERAEAGRSAERKGRRPRQGGKS